MKIAYADPPYLGCGARYYNAPEWDRIESHQQLIVRLCSEFPDGWALSLHTPSLQIILPMCPSDVRIAAWCKSFCAFKRGVRPAYAWEPVIFRGGRNPSNGYRALIPKKNGNQTTPKDFIVESIAMKRGLVGAKPEKVCLWILRLLNAQPGDQVDDLFPGTGVMAQTVAKYFENLEQENQTVLTLR